jgi:hypothetical protein
MYEILQTTQEFIFHQRSHTHGLQNGLEYSKMMPNITPFTNILRMIINLDHQECEKLYAWLNQHPKITKVSISKFVE